MGSRKKKVKVTAIEKEEKVEIGRCRGIKGNMDWIIQSQSLALCKMVASIKEKAYKHRKKEKMIISFTTANKTYY